MSTIPLKRGNTLTISGTYTGGSLAGVTVTSEMKRNGVTATLVCSVTDESAGEFTAVLSPAQSLTMAFGLWETDVRFSDVSGQVFNTETYYVLIKEAITVVTG